MQAPQDQGKFFPSGWASQRVSLRVTIAWENRWLAHMHHLKLLRCSNTRILPLWKAEPCNRRPRPPTLQTWGCSVFYHFLMNAYSHLPMGNESVWTWDIASFSHSVSVSSPIFMTRIHLSDISEWFPPSGNALPLRRPPHPHLHHPTQNFSTRLPRSRHLQP